MFIILYKYPGVFLNKFPPNHEFYWLGDSQKDNRYDRQTHKHTDGWIDGQTNRQRTNKIRNTFGIYFEDNNQMLRKIRTHGAAGLMIKTDITTRYSRQSCYK